MKFLNTIIEEEILHTNKGEYFFKIDSYEHNGLTRFVFNICDKNGDFSDSNNYSYVLVKIPNTRELKIIDMYANDFKKCGISIPIILKSKEIFREYTVISSSNKSKYFHDESNSEIAIQLIWEPMVKQGLADYIIERDIYIVI